MELARNCFVSQPKISLLENRGEIKVSDVTLKQIASELKFPEHPKKLLEFVKEKEDVIAA